MNIVYLCADRGIPVLGDKGASVHVREFATALAGLGHKVTLLCARAGSGNACPPVDLVELPPLDDADDLAREAALRGIAAQSDKVMQREIGKLAHDRGLLARAVAELQRRGVEPHLVYERYSLFHRAGRQIADAFGVPLVLEVNAPLAAEEQKYRSLSLRDLAERLERQTWREADRLVVVSDAVGELARTHGVPRGRIRVLPNGVDTARFRPGIDGSIVRARFGLNARPVIGFVGSLKPWHGVDFLLDAWPALRQRLPQATALIVGEGPMLESLRERIARERLGDVILTGRVAHAEVPAYLAAMDVTVAPYVEQEGFYFSPLKAVESLAAGRPLIAPRLGQLEHLIIHGETGMLYAPGDRAAFCEALEALLGDPERLAAMGMRAAHHARAHFSWQATARRALEQLTFADERLAS